MQNSAADKGHVPPRINSVNVGGPRKPIPHGHNERRESFKERTTSNPSEVGKYLLALPVSTFLLQKA